MAPPAQNPPILFEVPDFALCLQLHQRLQDDWSTWLVGRGDSRFVAVRLDPDDVNMEMLLKIVADWAGEVGLRYVRFQLRDQMSLVVASAGDV